MAQIFISHSSADREEATELLKWLHAQGFTSTFLDFDERRGIAPGADWEKTLYRELSSAEAVILILTKNWSRSKWCFVEFAQARALGKAIFPLVETETKDKFVGEDIQRLDLVKDREGGLDRLRQELTRITHDRPGAFPWDHSQPPYPGLRAFEEADAAIYFGREDDIRALIQRLEARRIQGGEKLVAVLGASGSGKSSLLRAGVVPRLKRDRPHWIVLPPFRPQSDPVGELAQAIALGLGKAADWRQWRAALDTESPHQSLAELARDLRAAHGQNEAHILVTIDQGEELFGAANVEQAARFFTILNAMLHERNPFLVALALRSDYLDRLQREPRLTAPFEQFSLKPMPLERIRGIIEGPAKVAGIEVDDALVTAAMRDAHTDDALPLLAFALRELYDHSAGGIRLTIEAYRALGDKQAQLSPLENAVRRKADEVLNAARPSAEELQALKDAFIPAMVRVNPEGEYVRHPAAIDTLPVQATRLIEGLTRAYLLTIHRDRGATVVEVTHEALLRKWPLLRGWLDEQRGFLIGREQLEQDLRDWDRAPAPQKPEALLWGLKLARAEEWLASKPAQLTEPERAFIKASLAHAARQRRLRILRTAGSLIAALCLIFGAVVAYQVRKRLDAQAAEARAHLATSAADLAFAAEEMQRGETSVSLAFLADALRQNPKNDSAIALAIAELRDAELPQLALASGDEVQDAQFSPDGAEVVTASADDIARLWNALTGTPIGPDLKHAGLVHTAEFSPDGRYVVTASYDGTAGIWDARTGSELHVLRLGAQAKVYSAHFSADGSAVVVAGGVGSNGMTRVWNARTGQQIGGLLISHGIVWDAEFDPKSNSRVVTGSEDKIVEVWTLPSGTGTVLKGLDSPVSCVAFSPDGRYIAAGADSGQARIWDAHSFNPIGKPAQHEKNFAVNSVAFSPDSTMLVTASSDDTARLWNVRTGGEIGEPMRHEGWVRSAQFSRDGKWVVTASYDRTARVWDAHTGLPVSPPMRHSGAVYKAHFDPRDPHRVVTASFDHTARIWDWRGPRSLPVIPGAGVLEQAVLEQACWDRSAQRIVTVTGAGTQIWDGRTGNPIATLIPAGNGAAIAACSSDGKWLAAAAATTAQVWDAQTGKSVGPPIPLPGKLLTPDTGSGLKFDPHGRWLATVSANEVRFWDPATAQPAAGNPIRVDDGSIVGVAFSPSGSLIATYTDAGTARIWTVPEGRPAGRPMTHDGKIAAAHFSPEGKFLLTASADHTARIWNAGTGAQAGILHLDSWVPDAEFSPDGQWIVTACADFTAQVWNARTYKASGQLMRQAAEVTHAEFSPDGRWVLTLAADGVAQVWDARSGDAVDEPILPVEGAAPNANLSAGAHFTADDNWIITFWNNLANGRSQRAWQLQVSEAPVAGAVTPPWLAPLAEGVGGLRVNAQGVLVPTPENEDPVLLRQKLGALPATDPMDRFGRWLASDPETRAVSPTGNP